MAAAAAKKEDSLSLQRLKAKIRKRNKKVFSDSKQRRLVLSKQMKE